MGDYGHFGKGFSGYSHYMESFKQGGGGRRPSGGGGMGCGWWILIAIGVLYIIGKLTQL